MDILVEIDDEVLLHLLLMAMGGQTFKKAKVEDKKSEQKGLF
jgi:hypothetical protein